MTAVPAPLASAGADVRAPAPITSAGVATHAAGWIPPRLSADSLRPYIGILGVLIGALLSTISSRITSLDSPTCAAGCTSASTRAHG
jgi:hypothetical protein